MNACEEKGHDVVHVAVRIPWRGGPVLVEHECRTYACNAGTWFEPARDVAAVLTKVLGRQPVSCRDCADPSASFREWVDGPPVVIPPKRTAITNGMDAVRDAPRPAVGTTTSDPDAFLEAFLRRRPHQDERPYA